MRNDKPYKSSMYRFFGGPRICSQCRTSKPREGGKTIPAGRYTERWVCRECAE